jgi:hypothetical protein
MPILSWRRLSWRLWSWQRRKGRGTTWKTTGRRKDLEASIPDLYTMLTSEASKPELHTVLASEAKGEEVEAIHGKLETLDSSKPDIHMVLYLEQTLADEARDEPTGGWEDDLLVGEATATEEDPEINKWNLSP